MFLTKLFSSDIEFIFSFIFISITEPSSNFKEDLASLLISIFTFAFTFNSFTYLSTI
jgi:hypothetical protein